MIITPETYVEIDLGSTEFYVLTSELDSPLFTLLEISGEELNRLGDGCVYSIQSFLKCVTQQEEVPDWKKNFRIAVFNNRIEKNVTIEYVYDENELDENNEPLVIEEIITDTTDYDDLSLKEIFDNASYWSDVLSEPNEWESRIVEFAYDENYPLYILFVGDFGEGNPTENILEYTSPIIAESASYREDDDQCIFPVPIKGVIIEEENASELSLNSYQVSNSLIISDFDVGDIQTSENMSILGVEIRLTVDLSDDMIIFVTLIDPNGVQGTRSVLITKQEQINNDIIIGGAFDLWGFDVEDMVDLDAWKVEIKFSNPFSNYEASQIIFENAEVVFYANHIDDQIVKIHVNGKDTRHYGMFIESVSVPSGLKTDVKYLEIEGADRNDAYRQNIDKKEIEIKFNVLGCTIEETTEFLKMIGKLFSNQRDELNRPIPNQLELSHYPDEYWDVILEDSIDSDVENASYSSTLKLVVPDGTSYNIEDTVTSTIGTCGSIAKVNPVISIIITNVDASSFEISELVSNQHLVINYSNFIEGDAVELDCMNRKLILKRYSAEQDADIDINITDAVDWTSDWFNLFGDYNFESKNCMIQTISFKERG